MAKQVRSTPGVRFVGDGSAYLPGVPMRDMTVEEWSALPDALRTAASASGLYEVAENVVVVEATAQELTEVQP